MRFSFKPDQERLLQGCIPLVAALLALRAFWELNADILNFEAYQQMFKWLTPKMQVLRYALSIAGRELVLLAAVLILLRKELGRRLMVFLSLLAMFTVYWKHPYQAVVNINQALSVNAREFLWAVTLPWAPGKLFYPAMMIRTLDLCVEELIVCGLTVVFFSLPVIKRTLR